MLAFCFEYFLTLKLSIASFAKRYRDNPFHNFAHASHVVMSVSKLMSRIVAPKHLEDEDMNQKTAASLHDHTYGITSDPLTQFACVFSALIRKCTHWNQRHRRSSSSANMFSHTVDFTYFVN